MACASSSYNPQSLISTESRLDNQRPAPERLDDKSRRQTGGCGKACRPSGRELGHCGDRYLFRYTRCPFLPSNVWYIASDSESAGTRGRLGSLYAGGRCQQSLLYLVYTAYTWVGQASAFHTLQDRDRLI